MIASIILKKNSKVGGFILLDFKTCYTATVSKTVLSVNE
jgi:hypothetical protein